MKQLTGVYTAIITPFHESGLVNEEGLRDNIRFQVDHGVDGILALGSTAEAISLNPQESEVILNIVKEEMSDKMHLMVGIGGFSTEETIHRARMAKNQGAHSLLVVTPFYTKPSQEGIYRHFSTLASEIEIPIIIYNNPGRSGKNIDPETILRLSKIENIVGLKESSEDIDHIIRTIEYIKQTDSEFSILSGNDMLNLPLLALGGQGVISVAANLIPQQIKSLYKATHEGHYVKAREIHYQLMPLLRALTVETNPVPIKTAMNLCGFSAGRCRLPLCELEDKHEKVLKGALEKTNIALGAKVY